MNVAVVMGLGALAALALAIDRYDLTLFVQSIGIVMVCVYLLGVLVPPLVVWTLRKLRVEIGERELRWLMLIFLLAFGVKAAGMMHPRFTYLDHVFRVHQVQELVDNPGLFWDKYQHVTTADQNVTIHTEEQNSMLGQWNLIVPFPYSPIGYFVLAPAGLDMAQRARVRACDASDTFLAALSGTIVFALFAIAARGLGSRRAGVIAAAIVSFAPITYLHFSDGAYPYIWAGWISVMYVMAAICLADRAGQAGAVRAAVGVVGAYHPVAHGDCLLRGGVRGGGHGDRVDDEMEAVGSGGAIFEAYAAALVVSGGRCAVVGLLRGVYRAGADGVAARAIPTRIERRRGGA